MSPRFEAWISVLRDLVVRSVRGAASALGAALASLRARLCRRLTLVVGLLIAAGTGWILWRHPPATVIGRGEIAVRHNLLTGQVRAYRDGSLLVLPGVHELRRFPVQDQVYRPIRSSRATGDAPFQSVEGLSLGVDLVVRYAIDPSRIAALAATLPDDIADEIVAPAVQGIVYPLFARYTVREIFSTQRVAIQQSIERQLRPALAVDGLILKSVQVGQVDLPQDYRNGMDALLAEELSDEKMRFTLELKDKQVRETALVAEADKVRREKAAEAAGEEQVIAARAQEEAMQHVLPFKEKQVRQRELEAEAEKIARIRSAEGNAQARRIEAAGEADSRQKLADAEVYRLEKVGKANAEQMAREGALITQNPLLIQKTLADKLSDKVQVIIAPPPADGGFIGSTLLGAK